MLLLAVGGSLCGLLLLVFSAQPRLAFVAWLLALSMLPAWATIHIFVNVPIHCVIAMVAVAAVVFRIGPKFTKFDAYFALLSGTAVAAALFGGAGMGSAVQIIFAWVIPFLAARVLVSAIGVPFAVDAIALILGLVAALAILEFIFDWHPFVDWNFGSQSIFQTWHTIQYRGGRPRSEWTFGHAIALGGSLALSIPFIVQSSYRASLRILLMLCVGAGIFATASRGPFIAAAVTAGICVVYTIQRRVVRTVAAMTILTGVIFLSSYLYDLLITLSVSGDQSDRLSVAYRPKIYSLYTSAIEWFGNYSTVDIGNKSIDSAYLVIGLQFGWIVLVLATLPLGVSAVRVLIGSASSAEIALVGQIPLLAVVAMVNQYESLMFIIAGLAVQMTIEPEIGGATGFRRNSEGDEKSRGWEHRSAAHSAVRPIERRVL